LGFDYHHLEEINQSKQQKHIFFIYSVKYLSELGKKKSILCEFFFSSQGWSQVFFDLK